MSTPNTLWDKWFWVGIQLEVKIIWRTFNIGRSCQFLKSYFSDRDSPICLLIMQYWAVPQASRSYRIWNVFSVTPCINTNFQQVFKCLPWYSDTHKEVNNPEKCPWKEPSWHRHHQLLCKIQWKCCQASKLAMLLKWCKKDVMSCMKNIFG